jgi:hypothetical protein
MRWTEKHCADTNSEKGTKILEFNEDVSWLSLKWRSDVLR